MTQKIANELISAIYQIAEERGLSNEIVIEQIKKAYITAYKKLNPNTDNMNLDVDIDFESGQIFILADKEVVKIVNNPNTQIAESQAKLIDQNLREGDHIQIDVTPKNFGRIAAKAAYQKLIQSLKETEINNVIAKYEDKVGKLINGVIQRKEKNSIVVEIEKIEAYMPISESIPNEEYKPNERKKFLLLKIQQNPNGEKRMILSRNSDNFLKALFEMEVPEIMNESVKIVNLAREPGLRSKVAVLSKHEKIDAIGSCIGPKGSRIYTIMNEIIPEKVDIVLYDKDPKVYIANALSPAKISGVKVKKIKKQAIVLVDEPELSVAIGKDGQNVRLAAALTGYKIDITSDPEEFNKFKSSKK